MNTNTQEGITNQEAKLAARVQSLEESRAELAKAERELDAAIVTHLIATTNDAGLVPTKRELAREARRLGLSKHKVYSRVSAAVVARKSPKLIAAIREGTVTFSAILAVEPYVHIDGVVDAVFRRTRAEVEAAISKFIDPLNSMPSEGETDVGQVDESMSRAPTVEEGDRAGPEVLGILPGWSRRKWPQLVVWWPSAEVVEVRPADFTG